MIQVFQTTFPPQNAPIVDQNGQVTTTWMSFLRALFGRTGQGTGLTNEVNTDASGDITADWNIVTGLTSSVTLPMLVGGQMSVIQNNTAFPLTINPPSGATIDSGPSYSLSNGKMQIFWFFSSTQIFSTQLG